MKISELKSDFIRSLEGLYPAEEVQSFFNIITEKYLDLSRIEIALKPHFVVYPKVIQQYQEAVRRLKEFEPIQYILGETEFYNLIFKVNTQTLIPRPETEELVEWILTEKPIQEEKNNSLTILDIGTGSGCIAISLAKNRKGAQVHALDISPQAIAIAKQNAELNKVDVRFEQIDILQATSLPSSIQYDIIVSNPPYVRELEKEQMQANVLQYEPATALFVSNEDPLIFYKAIVKLAKSSLKPNAMLFFEINEHFGQELKKYLNEEGFRNIELKKDIYGKDRMMKSEF